MSSFYLSCQLNKKKTDCNANHAVSFPGEVNGISLLQFIVYLFQIHPQITNQ